MSARYAGDIFYRPLMNAAQREYLQESELKRRFSDLRTLMTPGQQQYLQALQKAKEQTNSEKESSAQ